MKKILFVVKNMNIGGVEKSLISLLNTISKDEYQVDILLLEKSGGFLNQIPSWVNVIIFDEYKNIKNAVNSPPLKVIKSKFNEANKTQAIELLISYALSKLFRNSKYYYRQVFKHIKKLDTKYDVAVAYSSIINYLTWIVCYHVKATKKIGWIHFDISKLNYDKNLFLNLHNQMDKIYVVSEEALTIFCKNFPQLKSKCEVKYNVIDKKNILDLSKVEVENLRQSNEIIIMTLGRIEKEKGQDIIPEVAQSLKEKGIIFKWYLIGDGTQKKVIEEDVKKRGLSENVIFLGTKSNPYPYLRQADIYVQTSVHEGFCITLAEAKIFSNAIISTDFTGATEQLKAHDNSYVVQRNKEAFTNAIIDFLKHNLLN
ncbi:MAG: glycosyltransferase [Eubacterium sp.]